MKKGNFSSNSSDGLRIISTGNVTLDSILANYNAAALDVQTTGSVTLLGSLYTNQFNNSTSTAVVVTSTAGTITLSKFTAMNNGSDALSVDSSGKLAVIDATLTNNQGSGIVATAANGAAFTNVISSGNGSTTSNGSGILLTVTGNSVSFTKSSFNNNVGFGISISGSPVVTITSTSYVGNDTDKSGDRNYSGS